MCVMLFQFCMIISSLPSLRQPFHPTAMKKLPSYTWSDDPSYKLVCFSRTLVSIMELRLDLRLDLNDLRFASDLHKNTHQKNNISLIVLKKKKLEM